MTRQIRQYVLIQTVRMIVLMCKESKRLNNLVKKKRGPGGGKAHAMRPGVLSLHTIKRRLKKIAGEG